MSLYVPRMVNPTGKEPRGSDQWGSGAWHASRDGGKRPHLGIDLRATEGQAILSPIEGLMHREAHPYFDGGKWDTGVIIRGSGPWSGLLITMFYCKPMPGVLGKVVIAGEIIAHAMSLQGKYPGIRDHVHLAISRPPEGWMDPTPFLVPPVQAPTTTV